MLKAMMNFWNDEEGATAVEYGIMVALIAVGIIVSVEGLRDALKATFGEVAEKMPTAG